MNKPRKKQPDPKAAAWFPLVTAINVFDTTRQNFDSTYRPLVPAADIKNAGRRGVLIRLRGLIDALVAKRVSEAAPIEDPLLIGSGSDSPNLERYRAAKAGLAELDLEQRQKTHQDLRELDDALVRFGSSIRRAGEALQRRFGNEASDLINEAIDEALRQWQERKAS